MTSPLKGFWSFSTFRLEPSLQTPPMYCWFSCLYGFMWSRLCWQIASIYPKTHLPARPRTGMQVNGTHLTDLTLGGNLHTVHGGFQLKPGSIQFDPTTGIASGELIVDANSGDSGNGMRDRKMKREILETQKYPDI